MAYYSVCGIDCNECKFKTLKNCSGCKENNGVIFWGECALYKCNDSRQQPHCGKCTDFPCKLLLQWAKKENPERIDNLKSLIDSDQ